MNWKGFLKFTKLKLLVFFVLLLIGILDIFTMPILYTGTFYYFVINERSVAGFLINPFIRMGQYLIKPLFDKFEFVRAPFFLSSLLLLTFALDIFYWYLLSSLGIWIYNKSKKKK